ncbi:hypothetical protein RRG08_047050 [Elysia crispata]|uniref:Uncharacterized protein n=1 Tax=Elysia crispata TaxID=231223 RepID=A0AAE1E5Y9_9GAST|nr:hypothetical protein RRG08_047050 [Elysia crispata]
MCRFLPLATTGDILTCVAPLLAGSTFIVVPGNVTLETNTFYSVFAKEMGRIGSTTLSKSELLNKEKLRLFFDINVYL